MSKVISIITQKGGVGKTTTVNALAATMHKRGIRVLAIDMDPQGNLSYSFGAENEFSQTIYEALKGEVHPFDIIQRCPIADIIPSNILLSSIELEFTGHNREYLLRTVVEPLRNLYDYILIDSPPELGILTVNSLSVSDYVILPMLPDIFSLQGITHVYETIEHIRESCNANLKIAGILLNRYNRRSVLHREVYGTAKMLSENLNIPIFKTIIRNCIALSESQSLQSDITKYSKRSSAVKDFNNLADELYSLGIRD